MSTTTAQPTQLLVNRLIKAPRERVFAAWITPSEITKWFGSETCQIDRSEMDPRVGGKYTFHMKEGKGPLGGVYREITPPSRLVFTWNLPDSDNGGILETLVTVDFITKDGGTEVRITHEKLPTDESREQHSYGWNSCLEKLAKQY